MTNDYERAVAFRHALSDAMAGTNPYTVGSLLWVERNRYNQLRQILVAFTIGDMSPSEAAFEVYCLDTDSLQ